MGYKSHEYENHFMIEGPDGKSFPIAKKGLKKEVLEKIKSFGVQHFADGGIVGLPQEQIASEMPKPQPMQDPTIGLPTLSPMEMKVEETKEYLSKLQPGLYSSAPDLLVKDAQNMVLNQAERDANRANSEKFYENQKMMDKAEEDRAYNERASKLGLPLREIPGAPQLTKASMSVDGAMMPESSAPQQQSQDPFSAKLGAYSNMFGREESAIGRYGKEMDQANAIAESAYRNQEAQLKAIGEREAQELEKLKQEKAALTDQYASGKIDPERAWNSKSTGGKITAAIALALGGIGSGLTGRPNAALEVINGAIERDIEAQKSELGQKRDLIGQKADQIRTSAETFALQKANMIAATQAKIGQAAMKSQNAQVKLQAEQLMSGLEQKKLTLLSEVAKQRALQSFSGGDPSLQAAQYLSPDDRERYVPGEGLALSKEGAKELRTLKADRDASMDGINRLMEIRQKYGRQALPSEIAAEAKTIAGTLQGRLRTFLVGPGAVSDNERKLLEQIINKDVTDITSLDSTVLGSLKTLKSSIDNGYQKALVAQGVKPAFNPASVGAVKMNLPKRMP